MQRADLHWAADHDDDPEGHAPNAASIGGNAIHNDTHALPAAGPG